MTKIYTYLTMTAGRSAGSSYLLDPTDENTLGRGLDCNILLADSLCSRNHAVIWLDDGRWWLRDIESRNGTWVNEMKILEPVPLQPGQSIRLGTTRFTFQQSDQPPTHATLHDPNVSQTILHDTSLVADDLDQIFQAMAEPENVELLLLLYQLSIKLLAIDNPDETISTVLDLLREFCRAGVAGFLWIDDHGQLKPKLVIPTAAADRMQLSSRLTEVVCRQARAVWVDNQAVSAKPRQGDHFADAICVPLLCGRQVFGAIHLYLEKGRFRRRDFDFAVSVSNIAAAALIRARRQAILIAEHRRLLESSGTFDQLLGQSEPMLRLKEKITRVAQATGCVLIRGESGSGKELVAQALHRAGNRADRPMLSINCAAIPHDLMESQLFGHKRGAFTGADRDHKGLFCEADSGTLFLDEIGELSAAGQAKLLRVLEGRPFLPVGSTESVTVDVRVIAATNRDLHRLVEEKRFREDLFYRLSVFELVVPPLRERGEDIELLIDHFFQHFRLLHGRPELNLSSAARRKLTGYSWPGNVRQLRNAIDSAVVLAAGDTIVPDDLPIEGTGGGDYPETLDLEHWERKLIDEAMRRCDNRVAEAAKLLGLGRATLYRKLEKT